MNKFKYYLSSDIYNKVEHLLPHEGECLNSDWSSKYNNGKNMLYLDCYYLDNKEDLAEFIKANSTKRLSLDSIPIGHWFIYFESDSNSDYPKDTCVLLDSVITSLQEDAINAAYLAKDIQNKIENQ